MKQFCENKGKYKLICSQMAVYWMQKYLPNVGMTTLDLMYDTTSVTFLSYVQFWRRAGA